MDKVAREYVRALEGSGDDAGQRPALPVEAEVRLLRHVVRELVEELRRVKAARSAPVGIRSRRRR